MRFKRVAKHLEGFQSLGLIGLFASACFLVRKRPSSLPLMRNSHGFNLSLKDFSVAIVIVLVRLVLVSHLHLHGL